jgi:hypothetical protein
MRKRRVKAVIEESNGALHTNLTLPWYAFVLSPMGRRLITYVYPLSLHNYDNKMPI